ncbi:hypothetical protein GUITHDRAFT_100098 [Guillardia theta CCMP2712]|uniref:ABC-2 type transporter transmembrane domain-containing protein n=2 Tax=Guillardia theta TaxID=55529 RepID=L1K2M1_GUITC|nr:hypothetical protein GUITHDRAFT_100098 [Guillardia theta CCMP2712]EKX54623.1 hypothetical protein GUITHDRAFT_100098 [Guillardia theta CCMP2712]|eukprot:XP_005841603.1 hypothetical protein GUITHDRAFT_100098 [Guillardia theta CCMP2712]
MTSINSSMIAMVKSLMNFVEERITISRERRYYGSFSYLLSKTLAEAPLDAFFAALFGFTVHQSCGMQGSLKDFVQLVTFQALSSSALGQLIGASVTSPAAALAMGPPLILVLTIVGAVGPSGSPSLPPLLEPLRSISMIRYGCEGLCASELSAMAAEKDSLLGQKRNKLLLRQLKLDKVTVADSLRGQYSLLGGFYVLTLGALMATSPRIQPLEEPEE